MKKVSISLILVLISLLPTVASTSNNENVNNIKEFDLPARARLFLKSDFNHSKIVSITEETDDNQFVVVTEDGMRFVFDKEGLWTDVDCNTNQVPRFIIPSKLANSIIRYGGRDSKIVKIRRYGKNRFEVHLANETKMRFDKNYKMITNNK